MDLLADIPAMPKVAPISDASVVRCVDGDTMDMIIRRTGNKMRRTTDEWRARLFGVDTPETHGSTRQAGLDALVFTAAWVAKGASPGAEFPFRIWEVGVDNFGRVLIVLWAISTGECLQEELLKSGNAITSGEYTRRTSGVTWQPI